MRVKYGSRLTYPRLRVRRADEEEFAQRLAHQAQEAGGWRWDVDHGGGVANCYGYPAETECLLGVSDPLGNVVVWMARALANKITARGTARVCLPGVEDIWDRRVSNKQRIESAIALLLQEHRRMFSALEVLATCAP